MTIYGTPGGTPLNTTPFQGTQPGNAVQATLPGVAPGVGLFVPNANNASGATLLSEQSRGNIPHNVHVTNTGSPDSNAGRPILTAMSDGGRNGAGASPGPVGFDTLNSDANGGAGPGAGQSNQTEGPTSGQSNQVVGSCLATNTGIPAAPQYGG